MAGAVSMATEQSRQWPKHAPRNKRLMGNLVAYLTRRVSTGGADRNALEFVAANQKRHMICRDDFIEIPFTDQPRRIAFVDGGNATLAAAPSFMIGMNRVYYSLFCGNQRQDSILQPRIEFFSCATAGVLTNPESSTTEKGAYSVKLFVRNDADSCRLPSDVDLSITSDAVRNRDMSRDSLLDIPRKMAEWAVASSVIDNELQRGDLLIMDGTLQTRSMSESKFVVPICKKAITKGVILCGLAKTSTLVAADNLSLISRASELAEEAGFTRKRWFVGVCNRATANDMGYTYIVKFHEKSRYVFRFGVLSEQHDSMPNGEIESIFASIAANSRDISMLGYPYGAIDADRFAKVRMREASMHQNIFNAELAGVSGGENVAVQMRSMSMHQALNKVTG